MDFQSLPGLVDYEKAQVLQKNLVERRAGNLIPDTILFLEHASVVTRGRGLQKTSTRGASTHMPVPSPLPDGVAFAETERGGDLTWHGPGQLVIYPIVKLDGGSELARRHDVTGFLRTLEQVMIDVLADVGLSASRRPDATGVWVGERKIASIGISVRHGVAYHGVALNIVNDLRPFQFISPCGFSPDVMTRVKDLMPGAAADETWRLEWEKRIQSRFEAAAKLNPVRQAEVFVSALHP